VARSGAVAIDRWHRSSGDPIQLLSKAHGAGNLGYSHGVQLVHRTVYPNGAGRRLEDVQADRKLAPLISGEGPLWALHRHLAALVARPGP
jgi:hypothetical protein